VIFLLTYLLDSTKVRCQVKQVFIREILAKPPHTFVAVDGCVSPILTSGG